MAKTPADNPASRSLRTAAKRKSGRGARFEKTRQARAQRGDAQIDGKRGTRRDLLQQIDVAHDAIRFRGDRNA